MVLAPSDRICAERAEIEKDILQSYNGCIAVCMMEGLFVEKGEQYMKKFLSVVCMAAMLIIMAVCAARSTPEDTVSAFCTAAKSYDFKTMRHCMDDSGMYLPDVEELKSINGAVQQVLEFMQEHAETIVFEIATAEIDGEEATICVDFTYTDCAPVFLKTICVLL